MTPKQILEKKLKRDYAHLSDELDRLYSKHPRDAVTLEYQKGYEWVGSQINEFIAIFHRLLYTC